MHKKHRKGRLTIEIESDQQQFMRSRDRIKAMLDRTDFIFNPGGHNSGDWNSGDYNSTFDRSRGGNTETVTMITGCILTAPELCSLEKSQVQEIESVCQSLLDVSGYLTNDLFREVTDDDREWADKCLEVCIAHMRRNMTPIQIALSEA